MAEALALPYETDKADNINKEATVKIKYMGDVNSDGVVDMRDIQIIVIAFGFFIGHPRWNSEADLNQDGQIDIRDVAVAARNFGRCS